ncbi:hypothetical protein BDW02DRAFT_629995 [Decorospora gaudefroyi]|uniref:Uncharacterized protein n=1 Tax=Decorospora gaudefroyi TaxID=184978 RepID=A0A6A5KKS7_9PLEO|nr:hypothetical protein BDW02DRAFT_629995 [Decorospora gaudefroyi]
MPRLHINTISLTTFKDVLSRYPTTVPEKLRDLDAQRYTTIPAAVAARPEDTKHLTKNEVETLVEWKLKHGTFRPTLLGLVRSNNADSIQNSTHKAYASLSNRVKHEALPALKVLVGFRGIGPATASLLLSVMRPRDVPFFSDELFRWCAWDDGGEGWGKRIKYNFNEYKVLLNKVIELRMRLGMEAVGAVDVERVAWVLGKEGRDVGGGSLEEEEEGEGKDAGQAKQDEKEVVEDQVTKPVVSRGTKRKNQAKESTTQGTRKSTRMKR